MTTRRDLRSAHIELDDASKDAGCNQGSARLTTKRNTFYLLSGVTGMLMAGKLRAPIELSIPILIQGAFLVRVLLIYTAKRTVRETSDDERTNVIAQHAAVATLSVFWVDFFHGRTSSVVLG